MQKTWVAAHFIEKFFFHFSNGEKNSSLQHSEWVEHHTPRNMRWMNIEKFGMQEHFPNWEHARDKTQNEKSKRMKLKKKMQNRNCTEIKSEFNFDYFLLSQLAYFFFPFIFFFLVLFYALYSFNRFIALGRSFSLLHWGRQLKNMCTLGIHGGKHTM